MSRLQFTLEMPAGSEFATAGAIQRLAAALEDAGFWGAGYTDHPAPSRRWLDSGGHATLDPFAALSFLAAVTTRLRLMTYLAVLPYRNPFLTARCVATVDRLCGGRFTLVAGCGYLKSEFAALGCQFAERNERFDEAIDVLRQVWTTGELAYQGRDFTAGGQVLDPPPLQLPHPPIWIGGGSRRSRERAAAVGDGWAPLMIPPAFARTTRTAPLHSVGALAARWQEVQQLARAAGRDPAGLALQVDGVGTIESMLADVPAALDRLATLESAGVTHVVVRPPAGSLEAALAGITGFGAAIISH
jgi:probable F420-dependent oxidoreductase